MTNENTKFIPHKAEIKPAHVFELRPSSTMHVGFVKLNQSEIEDYTNINAIILKNTEKAQNFDFAAFSYMIFECDHVKLVYRVTYAEQINQDLLLVHLLKPLDTYDLLTVMQNDGQTGDIFYDLRSHAMYKIKDNRLTLKGLW